LARLFLSSRAHPPTKTHPLSLHDALPISEATAGASIPILGREPVSRALRRRRLRIARRMGIAAERVTDENRVVAGRRERAVRLVDRKSTRLNSSHVAISYAAFCLKKKYRL